MKKYKKVRSFMAGNYPSYSDPGNYIQTTFDYDVQKLATLEVNSKEFKELLVRMYQSINKVAIALNDKVAGYHPLTEFVTGAKFFPTTTLSTSGVINLRQEFIKVVDFGPLPDTINKPIPHGITIDANVTFTHIYATATKPTAPFEFIPIPYVFVGGPAGGDIELWVDTLNVNIQTTSNMSAYTRCYVILKYLKN
jgi:hypothetical protein